MTEEKEIMTLIGTETSGPTSLKLCFLSKCAKLYFVNDQQSKIFNIHNIAEIVFAVQTHQHTAICYNIRTRKTTSAKDLTVKLHVKCTAGPNFGRIFVCTEKWSEDECMGLGAANVVHLEILINITVSKKNITLSKLYEHEEFTDFQLSTAEGSLPVHKALLAANSDVFKMMLSREWKETKEGHIQIEGVNLRTLQDFKDYLYLGTLPDDGLCQLLLIANCYMIDNLKAECLMKLAQTVKPENLYDILEFSILNKMPELTFAVLGATPKSIVEDARLLMIKNQKSACQENND